MNPGGWDPQLYQGAHSFVWERGSDLIQLLDPRPGEQILDAGCGTGQLTARIAESGALVRGIDSSPQMVAAARENFPALEFDVEDVRALRARGEFDAVFSNAALHWVFPPEAAAESIASALKPGGRFVAEFGGKGNVASILGAVQRAFPPARNPWYFPSIAEYATVLESAGLDVTHAFHFPRLTPLEDGGNGLRNWLAMFGSAFSESVTLPEIESRMDEIEDGARPRLYFDNQWHADYVRIRIRAIKRSDRPV